MFNALSYKYLCKITFAVIRVWDEILADG